MYNSIRKYGEENFTVEVLEVGEEDTYMLKEREPYHISQLSEEERLNITDGGYGGATSTTWKKGNKPWNNGKKHPSASKHKKEYWEQWRKEHPNYKDKWKKREKTGYTAEERKARSQRAVERNKQTIECPHCGKVGNVGNMNRWHFDNCKMKK